MLRPQLYKCLRVSSLETAVAWLRANRDSEMDQKLSVTDAINQKKPSQSPGTAYQPD